MARAELHFGAHCISGFVPQEHGRTTYNENAHVVVEVSADDAHRFVDALVRAATRTTEYAELAGYGSGAYDEVIEELRAGIGRLVALKKHTHVWDGSDYCVLCGADGRA